MSARLKHPVVQLLLLLAFALIWRCDTFGDPNLHGDEMFYHTVGLAMHHGALPYVDVWDRKPLGLFVLFYAITALSKAPLAYQLVAALFAGGTAWAICRIACRWTSPLGAMLAGLLYLLWLAPLKGYGGQSPIFYNLLIALAALLVLQASKAHSRDCRIALAMLLGGLAITIKTTALFEAAFLGLYVSVLAWRAHGTSALPRIAIWAMIGMAPTLLIALVYYYLGHWPEFWHAMVASNVSRWMISPNAVERLGVLGLLILPVLIPAGLGLLRIAGAERRFMLGWLVAAVIGLVSVPLFLQHYALPLLVPLSVIAASFLAERVLGPLTIGLVAALSIWLAPPFQFAHTRQSQEIIAAWTQQLRQHSQGRGILSYEGLAQIYQLTNKPIPSPLLFPNHLSAAYENNVSHLDTVAEMRRILMQKPGAIMMPDPLLSLPTNPQTMALVRAYIADHHCKRVLRGPILERHQSVVYVLWGDCAPYTKVH